MWCRFYQWKIAYQIDDGPEICNARLKRHMDKCPACQTYADQLVSLRLTLGESAPCRLQPEAIRPLTARVMDVVARVQAPSKTAQPIAFSSPVPAKLFAGTLAASLLVMIGVLVVTIDQKGTYVDSVSPIHLDAGTFSTPLPVVASWPDKPMQDEVKQIGSDIERAVDFLVRSLPFVEPVEPAETDDEP